MEYKYTSIILGKKDVGETDRIYFLYTLENGKVQALAKGVRRAQAKLAGSLENFTYADITVVRNQGMGKVTSSVIENSFPSIRRDYDSLSKVFNAVNIFNKVVDFGNEDKEVFILLKQYLETMDSQSLIAATMNPVEYEEKLELLTAIFLWKLLNVLGYGSELNSCADCGSPVDKDDIYFSAQSGGIICKKCFEANRNKLMLSLNAVKLMRIAVGNEMKFFARIKVQRKDVNFLKMAIKEILAWI
ncbi:MAG: recombination protein RecO [uncultured bacterium]|nr:MAG: recombination protein RecO [uncultured bacterium]HBR71682.1 DNA repair protein RecO [Candidatus Moranbacteria bacterium]